MDINKKRNLDRDLSSCLQGLDSHKITERKLKRQEIQQLLENDEVIEVLNYNSHQQLQQPRSDDDRYHVTWKCLLKCYHRSLILDVEKEDIKRLKLGKNYKQSNLENSILLKNIINKANREQPYLPVNDLLKCILDVSRNNTYELFVGELYYKILEQNILSKSYYWHLLGGHWSDLFSLACKLYNANFANMKHISVKIMKHIVIKGGNHSDVTLVIKKKIFSYLKQAMLDTLKINNDYSFREDLILLVLGVCETIGVESRKSLCQFIEENCTHMINFYENDGLKKVQEVFYKLLNFFIKIHHPKSIDLNHKVSYFFNKNKWIAQLYQIYEFVSHEIQQGKNNSNPNFSNYISDLAVTIFNLVYYDKCIALNLALNDGPISKRKKYDFNLLSFIGNLTNLETSKVCTRLCILTKILENRSFIPSENDFIDLLKCLTKCLNFYKDADSTRCLIICCNVLMKSESMNKFLMVKLNQVVSFCKTVWTFILKTIMSNENPDVSHNLVQTLIILKNWHDDMYCDVLRPYFNKIVKIDDHSLKTLIILFKTRGFCYISLNNTNMLLLLDWLLPVKMHDDFLMVESYSKVDPYLLSEVVGLILTKPSINKSFINQYNLTTTSSNDFTDIYFYLSLQDIPKVQLKLIKSTEKKSIRQTFDDCIFERLICFVTQIMTIKEKSNIISLQCFFSLINFLCILESQFLHFNSESDNFRLYKYQYMKKVKIIVSELIQNENQLNNEQFVNVCSLFYKHLLFVDDNIVKKILIHEGNEVILKKLNVLSKLNDSNHMYQVLNYDNLSKEQKLSIEATKALLNNCMFKSQITQLNLLVENLKNIEDSICQPYAFFKFTNVLKMVLSIDDLPIDIIIQTIKFIKQIAKNWYFHEKGLIEIINLLHDSICVVSKNNLNNVCTSNLLMIIWSLQKISNSKKCGPTVICAFVDLLGHFASTDGGFFGSTWKINSSVVKPMSPENLLFYLNSPFMQVRINVIKYIKVICDIYECNPDSYIISYDNVLGITLHNIEEALIVYSDISEEERDDEYSNRIASYLLTMQSLIISSVKYRQKCLFEVLQALNEKKININLVMNLLEGVAIELKIKSYITLLEDNLNFLLWNWHSRYSTFKEFPFHLFSCKTIEQFLNKYSFEIIPILVIKKDLELLNCAGVLHKVIEENFTVIVSYLFAIKIGNVNFIDHDAIKNFIESTLGQQHFNNLIKAQYTHILLKCIQMVIESKIEQPIIPIQINGDQFLNIINIFQETFAKSKYPLLTIMSSKEPSCTQLIIHILYVNIFKKSTSELRFQSLFQYTFFMTILIEQLSKYNHLDEFTYFLVHQSIRSTISLINQNNIKVHHYALEYLEWLLVNAQRFLTLNINEIQPFITLTLRNLAKNQPSINGKLLNLFNILKKMNTKSIDEEINVQSESTLHKDIMVFLSQQNENADITHSLQHLKLKLKKNEKQLQNMYEELLLMRGFSEDCVKSILHRFISTLIQLTKSVDIKIQILAASCLGVLGPADLTTLLLQPEPETLKLVSNVTPEYSFIKNLVLMLLDFLSDDNITVIEASNITLFKIIATHQGQLLYDELGKSVLYPFKSSQIEEDVEMSFDVELFNLLIDVNEMWCPTDCSITYNDWITKITKQLLKTLQGFCGSLLPIAENKSKFCENILPHLIYLLIINKPLTRIILCKHLNCFFIKHYEFKTGKTVEKINTNVLQDFNTREINIYNNKSAIQCLLNVVNFARLQQKNPLQKLLDINYLYVSHAAQFCSAHFTSILYLELWCEMEFRKMKKDHWSMAFNPVDMITDMLPKDGFLLQSILNESYKSIGDSDAIEGCGSSYLLTLSSRTQYYQLLRKWDRVMENCDLQQTTDVISKDYLEAFSNSGLQNVAHIMAFNNDCIKYDYYWQLDKWDLPDNGNKSFEALHYHALRYVHKKNLDSAISMINEARLEVIRSLSCISLESTANVYTPLAKLKIIEDLEDFISIPDKSILFKNWLNRKSLKTNDFVNINKILYQRSKLLDFDEDNRSGILRLNIAEIAQKNDWLQEAGRNLATVVSLKKYEKHTILWAKVEEARLLWQRNDCHMAKILLKFVVEELDNNFYEYPFLQSLALQLYGSWVEETRSESASDIIKKYFQKSIKILPLKSSDKEEFGLMCSRVLLDAHKHLSKFTDTLYQQISKYIKTENLQKRINEVNNDKKKGKALMDLGKSTNNNADFKAGFFLMNQSNIDESDINNLNAEKITYLKTALQHYLQLMMLDDESDLPIYRIVSLWLENKDNDEINTIVDQQFEKSPSYKFIIVLPQLVAHLNLPHENSFHSSLENLINRCAMEHPYHTIPIVYAVANSNIEQTFIQSKQSTNNKEEARTLAAKQLMTNWKIKSKISSIVINTEQLYEAFIRLAYEKFSCSLGQRAKISNTHPLMKLNISNNYIYPMATLPLNKQGQYPSIISINKFENSFLNAGGLHQPKKIDCICTDGLRRSLLLKGNEDMRQDAVMQQVFVLMNRLLQSNKSTSKRKLTIRTYKVIPFSQHSGIAEWCVNTMSLGDYLIGKSPDQKEGAHHKYRPDDLLPTEAKNIIKSSKDNGDSQFKRLKTYMDVCNKIKPVFRYYFFEKFLLPSIWFERRQAYIHSVATNSMVGYILGLGDRHVQNILIDNNTAELIHIDFGVAFEQGTLLSTPETVPFRLTRDIVDGMGICGIEGTFRKCCEKTMSVLRQNQDVIVTVIEVLLHDPRYEWTLTEQKAALLQNQSSFENSNINSSIELNKLAERSLNKVRLKLCGMEEAGSAAASINGQCNRLIQEARDPKNLSLIFHGWQACL